MNFLCRDGLGNLLKSIKKSSELRTSVVFCIYVMLCANLVLSVRKHFNVWQIYKLTYRHQDSNFSHFEVYFDSILLLPWQFRGLQKLYLRIYSLFLCMSHCVGSLAIWHEERLYRLLKTLNMLQNDFWYLSCHTCSLCITIAKECVFLIYVSIIKQRFQGNLLHTASDTMICSLWNDQFIAIE